MGVPDLAVMLKEVVPSRAVLCELARLLELYSPARGQGDVTACGHEQRCDAYDVFRSVEAAAGGS